MEVVGRAESGRKPLCGGKNRNYYSVIILRRRLPLVQGVRGDA
jgi:hypothetical protein